jgi:hypothetical protein
VGEAGELAEALRRIRSQWEAATADGAAACGLPAAAGAFQRMWLAWSAELATLAAVLDDLDGGRR